MVMADYKCVACGDVQELPVPASLPEPFSISDAGICTISQDGYHVWARVWGPVGIGAVPGAGGSPSR